MSRNLFNIAQLAHFAAQKHPAKKARQNVPANAVNPVTSAQIIYDGRPGNIS